MAFSSILKSSLFRQFAPSQRFDCWSLNLASEDELTNGGAGHALTFAPESAKVKLSSRWSPDIFPLCHVIWNEVLVGCSVGVARSCEEHAQANVLITIRVRRKTGPCIRPILYLVRHGLYRTTYLLPVDKVYAPPALPHLTAHLSFAEAARGLSRTSSGVGRTTSWLLLL